MRAQTSRLQSFVIRHSTLRIAADTENRMNSPIPRDFIPAFPLFFQEAGGDEKLTGFTIRAHSRLGAVNAPEH